ncbi:hypothetical protein J6590_087384 [Homalodisca vitripennis]|nr:hypothetical protein J6590_087384 [Homalodisca vitripennis]
MAEIPGRGRGGRGAIIAKLLTMQKSPDPPTSSSTADMAEIPGRGRGGRGAIIAKLLTMQKSPDPPTSSSTADMAEIPGRGRGGRGAIIAKLLTLQKPPTPSSTAGGSHPVQTSIDPINSEFSASRGQDILLVPELIETELKRTETLRSS